MTEREVTYDLQKLWVEILPFNEVYYLLLKSIRRVTELDTVKTKSATPCWFKTT